jgi:hypothetical protein
MGLGVAGVTVTMETPFTAMLEGLIDGVVEG